MKKTTSLVLKGLLLYTTLILTIIIMSAVDSMSNIGIIVSVIMISVMAYVCYKTITIREAVILSGCKFFDRIMG